MSTAYDHFRGGPLDEERRPEESEPSPAPEPGPEIPSARDGLRSVPGDSWEPEDEDAEDAGDVEVASEPVSHQHSNRVQGDGFSYRDLALVADFVIQLQSAPAERRAAFRRLLGMSEDADPGEVVVAVYRDSERAAAVTVATNVVRAVIQGGGAPQWQEAMQLVTALSDMGPKQLKVVTAIFNTLIEHFGRPDAELEPLSYRRDTVPMKLLERYVTVAQGMNERGAGFLTWCGELLAVWPRGSR